jgi:hypothetical protein
MLFNSSASWFLSCTTGTATRSSSCAVTALYYNSSSLARTFISRYRRRPVKWLIKMYRHPPWSSANEDLVELFGTTLLRSDLTHPRTRSKGAGVFQFAQVAKAETAVGTFLSNCFLPVQNGVGGCSQVPAIQCIGGGPSMYASMTAVTRLPPQQPKEAGKCQCNWTVCEWLTWYPIKPLKPCMGLRVLMYVVVETHLR